MDSLSEGGPWRRVLELLRTVEQLVATLGAHVHTWGRAGEGRGGEWRGEGGKQTKTRKQNNVSTRHALLKIALGGCVTSITCR